MPGVIFHAMCLAFAHMAVIASNSFSLQSTKPALYLNKGMMHALTTWLSWQGLYTYTCSAWMHAAVSPRTLAFSLAQLPPAATYCIPRYLYVLYWSF